MSAPALAVLLDRDGVITEPVPDPYTGTDESPLHPEDVRLVPGAASALAELHALGLTLIVVSNQPAAAKGVVPLSELQAVHARAKALLEQQGVVLDGWEYCFHHPEGTVPELTRDCDCRKPRDGLLRRALRAHGIAPEDAWMVGDSDTDVLAGSRAAVRTALVEHPKTAHRRARGAHPAPDVTTSTLQDFVELARNAAEERKVSLRPTPAGSGAPEERG